MQLIQLVHYSSIRPRGLALPFFGLCLFIIFYCINFIFVPSWKIANVKMPLARELPKTVRLAINNHPDI